MSNEDDESLKKFNKIIGKIKADNGKDLTLFNLDGEFGSFLTKFHEDMRPLTREGRAKMVEPMHKMGVTDLIFRAVEHFVKQGSEREVLVYSKLLMDWTDCCEDVCRSLIAEERAIPFYLNQLEHCHDENANLQNEGEEMCYVVETGSPLLTCYLSLLYNLAKYSEDWPEQERVNGAKIAQVFLAYCKDDIQMTALCMLASLLSDGKDAVALADKFDVIPKLVEGLEKALKNEKEHLHIMYAEEFAEALAHLAINDENKKAIAKTGVIKLLVEMLWKGDELEQEEAVDCLWALSFDDSIRLEIKHHEGWEEAMKKIEDGAINPELKRKATVASDFITVGVTENGISKLEEQSDVKNNNDDDGHIFISYNWEYQETVLEIRTFLLDMGLKVWMDVDNMTNNTLEAMASGVEQAKLVLICYSEHYKQSNMCRTEAEYVFRLGKPFIPINMEYRYFPTGWLGIIIGARLYVDFSLHKHPLDEGFKKLMKEITTLLRSEKNEAPAISQMTKDSHDAVDMATPQQREAKHAYYLCPSCDSEMIFIPHENDLHPFSDKTDKLVMKIKDWSKYDVANWVLSQGFSRNVLKNFNGNNLVELFKMKQSAPDIFYRSVLKLVDNSLVQSIQLTAAIDTLIVQPTSE